MCLQKCARKLVKDGLDGIGKYRKFSTVDEAIRRPYWGNFGNNSRARALWTPLCRHLTITAVRELTARPPYGLLHLARIILAGERRWREEWSLRQS